MVGLGGSFRLLLFVVVLVCCFVGLLVCWSVGSLLCWFSGLLVVCLSAVWPQSPRPRGGWPAGQLDSFMSLLCDFICPKGPLGPLGSMGPLVPVAMLGLLGPLGSFHPWVTSVHFLKF